MSHRFRLACCLTALSLGTMSAYAAETTLPAECTTLPETVDETTKAKILQDCNDILLAKMELARKTAESAAAAAGKNISTEDFKEGDITLDSTNGQAFTEILANLALKNAAEDIAKDVCPNNNRPTIMLGAPESYMADLAIKTKMEATAEALDAQINKEIERLSLLDTQLTTFLSVRTDDNKSEKSFEALGEVEISSSALIPILSVVNDIVTLTRLLRNDSAVTTQDVTIANQTAQDAVLGAIATNGCSVHIPESAAVAQLRTLNDGSDLSVILKKPKAAYDRFDLLTRDILQTVLEKFDAKIAALNPKTEKDDITKLQAQRQTFINNMEARKKVIFDAYVAYTTLLHTQPTAADGTLGRSPYVRAAQAMAIKDKLTDKTHWLKVEVVESAGVSVISKGLFRSDRLHYAGSTMLRYRLVSGTGIVKGAGIYAGSTSVKVKDKDGFVPAFGSPEAPKTLTTLKVDEVGETGGDQEGG